MIRPEPFFYRDILRKQYIASFGIIRKCRDTRVFTFDNPLTDTLSQVIGCTVVWDLFSTVFVANLPVGLHVLDKLCPSFACNFTQHTFIMLFQNVHIQIFIRSSFKAA